MANYDYDVVIWDTVGGAYSSESMQKASGGSEKEVVQLAEALAARGFSILCVNKYVGRPLTHNGVTWDGECGATFHDGPTVRCKMLIVQRYSVLPPRHLVLPDRMVVRATDVYGKYYDHLSALTHLCVSEWQAKAFREAGFPVKVIPAMLDDDYYELASTPKVRGRFIYASAAMKGLQETIRKWIELQRRFPLEMKDCQLHVTSPGYGKIDPEHRLWGKEELLSHNVRLMPDLPPRELAKYMATCEGLFYCNVFPETFCAVAAIAAAVGCRIHVLAKNGLAGIPEATGNVGVFDIEEDFDRHFILAAGVVEPAADFRVSTVMPQWLAALHLDEKPEIADVTAIGERDASSLSAFLKGNTLRRVEVTGGNVQIGDGNEQRVSLPSPQKFAGRMRAGLTDKERAILDKRTISLSEAIKGILPNIADQVITPERAEAFRKGMDEGFPGQLERALGGRKMSEVAREMEEAAEKREMNSTPTVCLVMLAKNAESTLRRALDSVAGFVDCAVFQFDDEPSSEKMRVIIDDVFGDRWSYSCRSWVNFSVNRNGLLESARVAHPTDYVLTLDADDYFVGLNPDFKSRLTHDVYECDVHDNNGAWRYPRRVLWRADKGLHFKGPAHETLVEGTRTVTTGKLQGVHVERGYIPKSPDETRAKYLRDVRLFSAELRLRPDDTRSAYYFAQSLEDASCGVEVELQRDALEAYETRAKMGGFLQEKFVSAMKVGKIRKGLKDSELSIVEAFTQAVNILPERAVEAVYEIMLYYNNEGGSKEKAVAAHEAFSRHTNGAKTPEGFLVDVTIYEWGYRFQLAIALCYVNRKSEAKAIFEDLLTTGPTHLHDVLRGNLTYCVPPVLVDDRMLDRIDAKYGKLPAAAPDAYCTTTPDGGCVSADPRDMHALKPTTTKPVPWFTPKETR